MSVFLDENRVPWDVRITVATIKRVRSLLDVDLMAVVEGRLLEQLHRDPILLCDVLYAICKPQADAANITDEQFGAALAGQALGDATEAFLQALLDFFPPARRDVFALALEKIQKAQVLGEKAARTYLNSPELAAAMESALAPLTSGEASIAAPELPESIPTP